MTTRTRSPRTPARALLTALGISLGMTGVAAAHGPDPFLAGGPFGQNQQLLFRWRSGAEPVAAIRTAIKAAASDATNTRAAKAPTFAYNAGGGNLIGYGVGATCGVNGLACFTRDAPDGFTIWLREQGHVFDWGTLKWCQTYEKPPNGCYDAETITLDEFGHVDGLGHHVNRGDDSDYLDAVVQTFSRTKPNAGWNMHTFGRCDTATLQLRYDMANSSAKYSTCLDLSTVLTISASPTAVVAGNASTLTATLKVVDHDDYRLLGGNSVSGRTVTLQRRAPGATTWTSIGTMGAGPSAGTYVLTQRPGATTEYRAVFKTPSDEGINGDTSPVIKVTVAACAGAAPDAAGIAAPCI
jgi:hypothetical protein